MMRSHHSWPKRFVSSYLTAISSTSTTLDRPIQLSTRSYPKYSTCCIAVSKPQWQQHPSPFFFVYHSENIWNQRENQQAEHYLHKESRRSLFGISWAFWWARQNVPKGFEDFFPDEEVSEKTKTGAGTTKSTAYRNKEGKGKHDRKQQDNQKKPNSSNDDNANLPGLLALLAFVLTLRQFMEQEQNARGDEEITFVDFRNIFLKNGMVEKLIVVNQKMVQVILKPTAVLTDGMTSPNNMLYHDDSDGVDEDNNDIDNNNHRTNKSQWNSATNASLATTNTQQVDRLEYNSNSNMDPSNNIPATTGISTKNKKYYFYIGTVDSLEEKLTKAQAHLHPEQWVEVKYVNRTNWSLELLKLAPVAAFLAAIYFGSRGVRAAGGGGIFSIGKSNAKKIKKEDIHINFNDVAGCDEAKKEVMEFVDFLKDSDRFTKLGAKIPKGALLCGPPGTGKTLLAKAVAGEAGVPFYSISGSDFIEMFVGVGPSRVRDLFKEARKNAPCIVFIDEIDAVGRQRGRGGFSGGNDERENTLNQLLVEMDGFSPSAGVVVLAGTNRADILDQALTRPGRFDRQISVDKPDLQGRKDIFAVHLKGITLEGEIEEYAGRLAGLTPGFAGADIANICNEAAIVAARRKADSVTMADFEKATDRIIGGLESNKIMSIEERSIVAHHEAGHAVAGWYLEHADPLLKVTIIPRSSGALGFAQYLPKEVFLRSQDQIMDIVCMALAGRAAEEVFFGRVTTGASDDLNRVTRLVYSTIKDFGMNSKVGQLSFPTDNDQFGDKPYSDSTAEAMDDEARSIVDVAYQKTLNLVREKKKEVEKVANLLLDKETITHDDLVDLIGKRPFEGNSAYDEYVSSRGAFAKKKPIPDDVDTEETGSVGLTPGLA